MLYKRCNPAINAIHLVLLSLMLLSSICFAQMTSTFTFSGFSIEDYPHSSGNSNNPVWPNGHEAQFSCRTEMNNCIHTYYPSISIPPIVIDYRDNNATITNYRSVVNNGDMSIFSGHGNDGYFCLWDGDLDLLAGDMAYTNAKWVIIEACRSLQIRPGYNLQNFQNAFHGSHCLLGYESDCYWFEYPYCKWQYWLAGWHCGEWGYHHAYEKYAIFADQWVHQGGEIWLAWRNAVNDIEWGIGQQHTDIVPGVIPKCIAVFGNLYRNGNWQEWLGAYEKFGTLVDRETPMNSTIWEDNYRWTPWYLVEFHESFGNPHY